MIVLARTCLVILAVLVVAGAINAGKSSLPQQGVVPDEATAVKIAEAVLPPIFGEEEVAKFRPYHAQLANGMWTVYGTLKQGSRGGTPMIKMKKQDAQVLDVWHSQ